MGYTDEDDMRMTSMEKWEDKWNELQCDVDDAEQNRKAARDEIKMLQRELSRATAELEHATRSHTTFSMLLKFHMWLRPKEDHEPRAKRRSGRAKRVGR